MDKKEAQTLIGKKVKIRPIPQVKKNPPELVNSDEIWHIRHGENESEICLEKVSGHSKTLKIEDIKNFEASSKSDFDGVINIAGVIIIDGMVAKFKREPK